MRFRIKFSWASVTIQRYFRGWKVRRHCQQERAAIDLQSCQKRAAVVLQTHYRGWVARKHFALLKAAVIIQSYYRGWKVS